MNKYKEFYLKKPLAFLEIDSNNKLLIFENTLPFAIKPFVTCIETRETMPDSIKPILLDDIADAWIVKRVSWSENSLLSENGYKYITKLDNKYNIKWFKTGKEYQI